MLDGKKGYYSMRQVLERSIVFEKDSAAFYRNMKQKTSAAAALDLLAILERQEEQHAAASVPQAFENYFEDHEEKGNHNGA